MLPVYSGRPPLGLRTGSIPKPSSDTEPAVAPLFQYLRMHSPASGQRWVLATSSQPCQLVAAVSAPHCRRRGEPKSLDVNHIRHTLCELYCRPTCACASRLRPTPAVRRPL